MDYARRRRAAKRGGAVAPVPVAQAILGSDERVEDLVAMDDALSRLAALDAGQGRIVELRFVSGSRVEEAAEVLGISAATVKRE